MAAKTLGGYPEFARETIGATGALNDFQGRRIGQARILSKWKTPKSYVSSEMFQIEVTTPEGFVYTGRGAGSGMLWKGKLKATQPRSSRTNGRASRPNGTAKKRAAPKRRTRRNPEVECREPQKRFDRYRSAKVWDGEKWIQLEGCHTGARYIGRAEGAKKRTTISKKVVRQKASRTPSRVKGVRARKRK